MATVRSHQPPDSAPAVTHSLVRIVAAVAIALTVWLSIIDTLQLALPPGEPGDLGAGILAIALAIPLHITHLIYGVRGQRPPHGAWTLAALAIVTAAGTVLAGGAWLRQLSPLAVSTLIVIPGFRGVVLAGLIAVTPMFVVGPGWYAGDPPLPGIYLTLTIVWRTVTQFLPLKLLAVLRALDSANQELETRAVVQMRVRIDTELRTGVGQALQRVIAHGEAARDVAQNDPVRAVAELGRLVNESRRGLADARRMVAGYRASSLRAELEAGAALLEASGASVRIAGADNVLLDLPDQHARGTIRAAIAAALRGKPHSSYRVEVTHDSAGALAVKVAPDDEAASVGRGRA